MDEFETPVEATEVEVVEEETIEATPEIEAETTEEVA